MYTCRRFLQNAFHLSCVQEMCLIHQISCVQEMCLKCHLYCVLIFSFMPPNLVIGNVPEMSCILATGYVPEMSCVLATGNLPEILPYTVPGNVKEMSKFPGVGNVHTMNRNCELSCTFHGISWPSKFKISSSVTSMRIPISPHTTGVVSYIDYGFDIINGRKPADTAESGQTSHSDVIEDISIFRCACSIILKDESFMIPGEGTKLCVRMSKSLIAFLAPLLSAVYSLLAG